MPRTCRSICCDGGDAGPMGACSLHSPTMRLAIAPIWPRPPTSRDDGPKSDRLLQVFEQFGRRQQLLRIDAGQKFLAERDGLGPHFVVERGAGRCQYDPLDSPIRGRGLSKDQSCLHQTVHHGHHGRAFHTQGVRQLRLRQGLTSLGCDRNRHPTCLADTQELEPTIQRLPAGFGGVEQSAAETLLKIGHLQGL